MTPNQQRNLKERVFIEKSASIVDEDFLQTELTNLIHGSGFDGTWKVVKRKRPKEHFSCSIGYHCMNDAGYYDGWITLKYKIYLNLEEFDLRFSCTQTQRNHYVTGNKSYFEDTFSYALDCIKEKAINKMVLNLSEV